MIVAEAAAAYSKNVPPPETKMPKIETQHGVTRGTSDCGRFAYAAGQPDIHIDSKRAWRGEYCNPETGFADAGAVDAQDWADACALMNQTNAAHQAYVDLLSRGAHAVQDAQRQREDDMLDAIGWQDEEPPIL